MICMKFVQFRKLIKFKNKRRQQRPLFTKLCYTNQQGASFSLCNVEKFLILVYDFVHNSINDELKKNASGADLEHKGFNLDCHVLYLVPYTHSLHSTIIVVFTELFAMV